MSLISHKFQSVVGFVSLLIGYYIRRNSIIILGPGGLGDYLLGTPLFRSIKEVNPELMLYVLLFEFSGYSNSHKKAIFENSPHVTVLVLPGWAKYLLWLFPKKFSIRYSQFNPGAGLFKPAHLILIDKFNSYLEDSSYHRINRKITNLIPQPNSQLDIFLTDNEKLVASKTIEKFRFPVTIQVSADCSENKEWSIEKWNRLVMLLPHVTFLQLGVLADSEVDGAVGMRHLSIREQLALVGAAKIHVGIDSFFAHVSSAVGTPAVVMFGDTSPEVWGHPNYTIISKEYGCSPCHHYLRGDECPYGKRCMEDIAEKEVMEAINRLLTIYNKDS